MTTDRHGPGCNLGHDDNFLCCHCGFQDQFGCSSKRVCCSREWSPSTDRSAGEGQPPEAVTAARKNLTSVASLSAEKAICSGEWKPVLQCTRLGAALHEHFCRDVFRFATTLSQGCADELARIPRCTRGVLLSTWASELHAPKLWGAPRILHHMPSKSQQATGNSSHNTPSCLKSVYRLERMFVSVQAPTLLESFVELGAWFQRTWVRMLRRCADVRHSELRSWIARFSTIWPSNHAAQGKTTVPSCHATPQTKPRIGVIMALNWARHATFYGQSIELWECYCRQHRDCSLVLHTGELPEHAYPLQTKVDYYSGKAKVVPGKEWNRWIALSQHLPEFDFALTVDPDQFPSGECFLGMPLQSALDRLGLAPMIRPADSSSCQDKKRGDLEVVMRDHPRFQRLQSTSVLVRRSPAGKLFLELVLEKMRWPGLPVLDQSAFEQTVLEFLEIWAHIRDASKLRGPGGSQRRSADCLIDMLPTGPGRGWQLETYVNCWHDFVEAIVGPFGDIPGQRGQHAMEIGCPIFFADPRIADLSYTRGARKSNGETPLFWHLEGRDKHYTNNGTSLFDVWLRELWGNKDLPKRRPPGKWTGVEGSGDRKERHVSVPRPRCSGWVDAAIKFAAPCNPGTQTEDCRGGNLAVC